MAIEGTGLATRQVVPHLLVRGVAQAVRFCQRALAARSELFTPSAAIPLAATAVTDSTIPAGKKTSVPCRRILS